MIKKIIQEIVEGNILPESNYYWSELKGGTDSRVGVIGTSDVPSMFVVKLNTPERIAAETRFFQIYQKIPLLPKVKYVDPQYRYFIYDYIVGKTNYNRKTKQELMSDLMNEMIQYYVHPESENEYEWIEDPRAADGDIEYCRSVIGHHLDNEDHVLVKEVQNRRIKRIFPEDLYVLHGDFGVHNFLFEHGKLHGIIDPTPVIGRKLYDVLYAFCSSPDDLHFPILWEVVNQMDTGPIDENQLKEDMILALYSRIATCLQHHPEDIAQYQNAWFEWKQFIREI